MGIGGIAEGAIGIEGEDGDDLRALPGRRQPGASRTSAVGGASGDAAAGTLATPAPPPDQAPAAG